MRVVPRLKPNTDRQLAWSSVVSICPASPLALPKMTSLPYIARHERLFVTVPAMESKIKSAPLPSVIRFTSVAKSSSIKNNLVGAGFQRGGFLARASHYADDQSRAQNFCQLNRGRANAA